jgi:hypothetical protein
MEKIVPGPYGSGFELLSPTVFYRTPRGNPRPSGTTISKEPYLILLASWLNAEPRHVAKIAQGYERLFPTARLLILSTSTVHFLVQPTSQRIKEFEPVLGILNSIQPQEKVLLHAFSSGGATAIFQLAKEYQGRTGLPLPISKAIFDSCPGTSGYLSTVRAFSVNLPQAAIIRGVGAIALRILFGFWSFAEAITGTENIVDVVRRGLNNAELFDAKVARLYVYSAKDEMIDWRDVETHADEAKAKSFTVEKLRYQNSVHVGHLFQDPARYWDAVTALWDSDYLSGPGMIVVAW